MGISVEQWRGSIGLYYLKINTNLSCSTYRHTNDYCIMTKLFDIWSMLVGSLPMQLLIGMLTIFSYCSMVVTLFALVMTWYTIYFIFLKVFSPGCTPIYDLSLYIVQTLLIVNVTPKLLAYQVKNYISILKSLSVGMKNFLFFLMVLQTLLVLSGTVETNPGPVTQKKTDLSFAMWNLDSIPARDYARVPLIETFQATYDFEVFGVCESFLSNTIPNEDIFINGFSPDPFRADKPINVRNGGVCLYYKENLPIKQRCDLELLPETIVAEVKLNRIFFSLSSLTAILTFILMILTST